MKSNGCFSHRRIRPLMSRGMGRGFTLIELLVVVGIIGLLMSILLPALGRARQEALKITCAANLRQWGAAYQLYAQDNNNRIPYNGRARPDEGIEPGGLGMAWNASPVRDFINEYLTDFNVGVTAFDHNVIFCPTDEWHRSQNPEIVVWGSLVGYHNLVGRDPSDPADPTQHYPAGEGWVSKDRFDGPYAATPLMADINQRTGGDGTSGPHEGNWAGSLPVSSHAGNDDGRPIGSNFVFEDGRTEWHNDEEIDLGAYYPGWNYYYKIPVSGLVTSY